MLLLEYNTIPASSDKTVYLLALIGLAMSIDFICGVVRARVTKEILSRIGINGILKKMAAMMVLILFFFTSFFLPEGVGVTMTSVLFTGYFLMEVQSILENLEKMGITVDCFKKAKETIERTERKEDGEDSNR